jgi:hypothetical protein
MSCQKKCPGSCKKSQESFKKYQVNLEENFPPDVTDDWGDETQPNQMPPVSSSEEDSTFECLKKASSNDPYERFNFVMGTIREDITAFLVSRLPGNTTLDGLEVLGETIENMIAREWEEG